MASEVPPGAAGGSPRSAVNPAARPRRRVPRRRRTRPPPPARSRGRGAPGRPADRVPAPRDSAGWRCVVAPVGEEAAQRPVGVRVRRIVFQRAEEVIHRFVPPAEHEERAAQIHPRRDVFRTRGERLLVELGGFPEAPGAHVEVAEVVEDVRVAGLEPQQVAVERLGRLEVSGRFGAQRPLLGAARGHRRVPDLGEQRIVHGDQVRQFARRLGRGSGRFRLALPGVEPGEFGADRPGPRGERGGSFEAFARRLQLTAPQEQTPDPEFGEPSRVRFRGPGGSGPSPLPRSRRSPAAPRPGGGRARSRDSAPRARRRQAHPPAGCS